MKQQNTTLMIKPFCGFSQDDLMILSSSGSSLTSWLTPRQVYEKSREDPEIEFVMG